MKGKSLTFRTRKELHARLEKLATATDRSLTFYLEQAIEAHLSCISLCHVIGCDAMKGKSLTFRPRKDLRERLEKLAAATDRSLTYYVEKAIEAHLPALEEKYADELSAINHCGNKSN